MIQQPTEPSPLARALGLLALGDYDPTNQTYTITFNPKKTQTNFFGTVHGGIIAAICDDTSAMLAYFIGGINTAITNKLEMTYHGPARPGQPLTFVAILQRQTNEHLFISVEVYSNKRLIAIAQTQWQKRIKSRP